jgi:nicotinamidase-related amidase
MNVLVVVDMQKDFVDGALGTKEAIAIVPKVAERIEAGIAQGETILFTRDTHFANYMDTQEGKHLPVPHCVFESEGWEIIPELRPYAEGREIINKPTFGSPVLGKFLRDLNEKEEIRKITFIGLCTDICVISNALMTKGFLWEAEVAVDALCCAGVTPESHKTALAAMKPCQIIIENE